ncbi:PTS sugar transporter subunit IIA [Alloiococcus sp. CFN-8]|uniref:PTS sugar transporter subunit IIA n=1 Tax=Alloiococcus sp. CFN-8 TaxID=3416081 RepID=UPI003CE9D436
MEQILKEKNIFINCKEEDKEAIIRRIGEIFYREGCTTEKYTAAMLEKESLMNTYIGNSIAIPHGIESSRGEVLKSCIVVMIFPEGTDWNGEKAKIVIGIAGTGNDHINILSNIACVLSDEEAVSRVIESDRATVMKIFGCND